MSTRLAPRATIILSALLSPALLWAADNSMVEHGRYLITITGCNDCHTAGFAASGGQVPESEWLLGDGLGWKGPWGTTYATNLRNFIPAMSEDEWVEYAKTLKARPPMPWFNVNAMKESDLRAMYQFIASLGPKGEDAPAYVPPTEEPQPPFVTFPAPPPSE